jgi:hypothetical protein
MESNQIHDARKGETIFKFGVSQGLGLSSYITNRDEEKIGLTLKGKLYYPGGVYTAKMFPD